jgi:hypothetical protein
VKTFFRIISLALAVQVAMLPSSAAWTELYVQTTGSNRNAGDTTSDTGTTFAGGTWENLATASTHRFVKRGADLSGVVTNRLLSVYPDGTTGNTAFVGLITGVDDRTGAITVSATRVAGTAPVDATGNITAVYGGAWKGPNAGTMFPFAFVTPVITNAASSELRVNFKSGDYIVTNGITNAINGPIWFEGYGASPGDGGGTARIMGRTTDRPFIMLASSGTGLRFKNLRWERNGYDSSAGNSGNYLINITGTDNHFQNCRFYYAHRTALRMGSSGYTVISCEFNANQVNGGNGFAQAEFTEEGLWAFNRIHFATRARDDGDCHALQGSTATGETVVIYGNIISHNGGSGVVQLGNSFGGMVIMNNIISSNTHSGIRITSRSSGIINSGLLIMNNILDSNGDYGIQYQTAWGGVEMNNFFYNNTDGATSNGNSSLRSGAVTLTGRPFVDADNGNFALNNTPGAGAAVRAAAYSAFLAITNFSTANIISYLDGGAVQHGTFGGDR